MKAAGAMHLMAGVTMVDLVPSLAYVRSDLTALTAARALPHRRHHRRRRRRHRHHRQDRAHATR